MSVRIWREEALKRTKTRYECSNPSLTLSPWVVKVGGVTSSRLSVHSRIIGQWHSNPDRFSSFCMVHPSRSSGKCSVRWHSLPPTIKPLLSQVELHLFILPEKDRE